MSTDAEDLRIANRALVHLGLGKITDFVTDVSPLAILFNDQYTAWVNEMLEDHPWNFAIKRAVLAADDFTTSDITNGADYINLVPWPGGHQLMPGNGPFRLTTTDTLPDGYLVDTNYWVYPHTADDRVNLAANPVDAVAGLTVHITDDGTGVMTMAGYPIDEYTYAHRLPGDYLTMHHIGEEAEQWKWRMENGLILHNVGSAPKITYVSKVLMPNINAPLFKRALSLRLALDLAEAGVKTTSLMVEVERAHDKALARAKSRDGQEGSPPEIYEGTWATEQGRAT